MGNREKKTRKPKFLTQSPTRYITQVDSIMLDHTMSTEQKIHGLNGVWRDAMRSFGYFSDTFRNIDQAITAALKECEGVADG